METVFIAQMVEGEDVTSEIVTDSLQTAKREIINHSPIREERLEWEETKQANSQWWSEHDDTILSITIGSLVSPTKHVRISERKILK